MAFRSRLEEKVADLLVDLDVKYEYETVKVDYTIAHIYKPDFILPNGVHLECKGYWDSKDRRKIKAVKEQNPDLELRMVFQAPYNLRLPLFLFISLEQDDWPYHQLLYWYLILKIELLL